MARNANALSAAQLAALAYLANGSGKAPAAATLAALATRKLATAKGAITAAGRKALAAHGEETAPAAPAAKAAPAAPAAPRPLPVLAHLPTKLPRAWAAPTAGGAQAGVPARAHAAGDMPCAACGQQLPAKAYPTHRDTNGVLMPGWRKVQCRTCRAAVRAARRAG